MVRPHWSRLTLAMNASNRLVLVGVGPLLILQVVLAGGRITNGMTHQQDNRIGHGEVEPNRSHLGKDENPLFRHSLEGFDDL